jgi:hypothetical protein
MLLDNSFRRIDLPKYHIVIPEIGKMLENALGVGVVELRPLHHDIDYFDIGIDVSHIILSGQFTAKLLIGPGSRRRSAS